MRVAVRESDGELVLVSLRPGELDNVTHAGVLARASREKSGRGRGAATVGKISGQVYTVCRLARRCGLGASADVSVELQINAEVASAYQVAIDSRPQLASVLSFCLPVGGGPASPGSALILPALSRIDRSPALPRLLRLLVEERRLRLYVGVLVSDVADLADNAAAMARLVSSAQATSSGHATYTQRHWPLKHNSGSMSTGDGGSEVTAARGFFPELGERGVTLLVARTSPDPETDEETDEEADEDEDGDGEEEGGSDRGAGTWGVVRGKPSEELQVAAA